MSKTNHTPGPWEIVVDPPYMPQGMRGCVITGQDPRAPQDFAEVWDVAYLDRGAAPDAGGVFSDQIDALYRDIHEANARLIAVAPDLLAACKLALEFIRNGREFGYIRMPDPSTPDNAWKTQPALEAAIAKAEGAAT